MIKQLTLFCTLAIFMLAVGGAVTPLQAHCQKQEGLPHTGDHPHCTNESQIYPVYDVKFDGGLVGGGAILPGDGVGWVYDGKSVASLRPRDDILNMSYFYDVNIVFDNPYVSASDCFDQRETDILDPPSPPFVKFGGFLQKHQKSTAKGMFWFVGTTSEDSDGDVLYLLKIEGTFVGDETLLGFPKNRKIMRMDRWTLKIEGGGEVSSRACEGSDKFRDSESALVTFDVTFIHIEPPE